MCKEVTTRFICERCGAVTERPAKKRGPIITPGPYPADWGTVHEKNLCPECVRRYNEVWQGFMSGSKKTK